ncbi:MAG: phage tail tube protein [Phascolarctobacterium sp.]
MTNSCPWGVGSKTKTFIAFESTYGEKPADAASKSIDVYFNTNGVAASQNTTSPNTIRGNRNPVEPIMGNIDVTGDIVVPVDYTAFGYWLKAMFGAPSTSAVSDKDGYYQHVFKVGEYQPSFTLEKAFPGISQYLQYCGCKVSKLSLSVGGDGELTATISVMGAKESVVSETMAATPIVPDFQRAKNFQSSIKIGNEIEAKGTSFSMDIDAGLDGDSYCIGSNGYRTAVCEGIISCSGTLEAFFADVKYISLADTNAETSAEVTLNAGDYSLSVKFPEIKFARTSPSIDGPTGIKQSLNYNAYYDDSVEASAVIVTLVNKTAGY